MLAKMPRRHAFWTALPLLLGIGFAPLPVTAETTYQIGYIDLRKDDRYKDKALYARYLGKPLGRPVAGAEVAMKEIRFHGANLGITFALRHDELRKVEDLGATLQSMREAGIDFVLADLPAPLLLEAADAASALDLTLLNVSAPDDALRQEQCRANVYHVLPSNSMRMDALAQYLVSARWKEVLVLVGPLEDDQQLLAAFRRAAKKYGLEISDTRDFVLGNDPRVREKNNPRLLTQGDHDVIFVADSDGEFARHLPYRTVRPDLLVGTEGLSPLGWHWAWDRHGAPQLEKRFEKMHDRPMATEDWAAWFAVKAVASAIQGTESTDREILLAYFTDEETVLDGFKGNRVNFRAWNNQLRQPILLGTHNWVIERAPLEGFLHHEEKLDTLGIDRNESRCEF